MSFDVLEAWFVHRGHARTVGLLRKAIEVDRDGYGPHGWFEVVESVLLYAKPISHIAAIGHCGRQSHHSGLLAGLGGDQVHPRHDHF